MLISVMDLGLFVLFLAVVALCVYLIITLRNVNMVVSNFKKILDENDESINTALENLPSVVKNAGEITENVKVSLEHITPTIPTVVDNVNFISGTVRGSVEKVDYTIETVGEEVLDTVSSFKERSDNVISYMEILAELLRVVIGMFTGSKK